jgi:hypothetical protein
MFFFRAREIFIKQIKQVITVRYDVFVLRGEYLPAGGQDARCRRVIAAWVLQWGKGPDGVRPEVSRR